MVHTSSASSTPQILVEATLPPTCSFASPEPPELRVTLILEATSAVTIIKRNGAFWPIQNALVIVDASAANTPVILPRVEANYSSAAPLMLSWSQEALFITLEPGIPYVIAQSLRPFGHEIFDAAKVAAMGAARYRLVGFFGMHQLVVGHKYLLVVEQGLRIFNWMFGIKEELLAVDRDQANAVHQDGEPIPIIAGGQIKFRVES